MTNEELLQIRQMVRQEILGTGPAIEFADLCKVETEDSYLPREDGDWPDIYSADSELEKLTRGEALSLVKHAGVADVGWDQEVSAPLVKRANVPQDGTVIEKCGTQTWTYFYRSGELDRISLDDPEIAGGSMQFDGEGNEIAA